MEEHLTKNKDLARQFIEAADAISAGGDWNLQENLVSQDFVTHTPGKNTPLNFAEFKSFSSTFSAGFPGFKHVIEDQVAEGDKVANRITWHGSHTGEFHGIAPTNRSVTMSIINIMRFQDGKLAEFWRLSDIDGLLNQIKD